LNYKTLALVKRLFERYFELAFWITGLLCLAFTDPNKQAHFSLCPIKLLGFKWCPGCGLGHSISFLFRGDVVSSFHAHWFGIPALFIIVYRIYVLGKERISKTVFLNKVVE